MVRSKLFSLLVGGLIGEVRFRPASVVAGRRPAMLVLVGLLLAGLIGAACSDDDAPVEEAPAPAASEVAEPGVEPDPSAEAPAPTGNVLEGAVAEYAAGVDYFPDKAAVAYAQNFAVEYFENYKVVTVAEPVPGGAPESYVLVQRGTPAPALTGALEGAALIEVPVASIFSGATTHLPFLVELDVVDRLTGVGSAGLIHAEPVLARVASGAPIEYAVAGAVDTEAVIEAAPDVLISVGVNDEAYPTLQAAGVAVVSGTEWLEPSPLGRAEWVKYVALFVNREAEAEAAFASIEQAYLELVSLAAAVAERPTVMTGALFDGVWYAAGGDSFVAQLLQDAGAAYVWADNRDAGSIPLDFEAQLERAQDAEFWINVSLFWSRVSDAAAEDSRYESFDAYQSGNVWNYTRIENAGGGLEYFERGVSRPDLVLADLLKVFHPELVPEHELIWYEQLPAE